MRNNYKYFSASSGKNNRTNFPVSSGSQATFRKLLRVTGGYWKARTSSLKRVTKGISKLVRDFIEGSGNLKKTSSTHSKSTYRKNIHIVTLSLSTKGKTHKIIKRKNGKQR
jgi:hypothetical protein